MVEPFRDSGFPFRKTSQIAGQQHHVAVQHENSSDIALNAATTTRQTVVCRVVNGAGDRISSSFHAATAALWPRHGRRSSASRRLRASPSSANTRRRKRAKARTPWTAGRSWLLPWRLLAKPSVASSFPSSTGFPGTWPSSRAWWPNVCRSWWRSWDGMPIHSCSMQLWPRKSGGSFQSGRRRRCRRRGLPERSWVMGLICKPQVKQAGQFRGRAQISSCKACCRSSMPFEYLAQRAWLKLPRH